MKDEGDLRPGEVMLSPVSVDGHRYYRRCGADGRVQEGIAVRPSHPCAAQADEFIRMGEVVRPGVRRVAEHIPFTARASTGAASDAYRNGWDAVFGGRRAGDDGCNGNQAN